MKYTKSYAVLFIYNLLLQGAVSPKMLRENLEINEKQLWNYIKDIKIFLEKNIPELSLKYSKSTKTYYLETTTQE